MVDVSIHYVAALRRRPRYPWQFTCLCFSVLMFEMLEIYKVCKVCKESNNLLGRYSKRIITNLPPKHLSALYNQLQPVPLLLFTRVWDWRRYHHCIW